MASFILDLVRPCCHKRERFSDFVLARILSLEGLEPSDVDAQQGTRWHTVLILVFAPHPERRSAKKRVVELDYGMQTEEVKLPCRQAFLYYTSRELGLHTKEPADPAAQQIKLKKPRGPSAVFDAVGAYGLNPP